MNLTAALIVASASLLAAGLAALASLLVTVLTKESKTSEFRQQWIDALREDLAALVSEIASFKIAGELHRPLLQSDKEKKEFLETYHSTIGHIFELIARIHLRLNPAEHMKLIRSIEVVMDTLNAATQPAEAGHDLEGRVGAIVQEARIVLKNEWEHVKRGEPAFYWAKRGALAIIVLALAGLTFLAYRAVSAPAQAPARGATSTQLDSASPASTKVSVSDSSVRQCQTC